MFAGFRTDASSAEVRRRAWEGPPESVRVTYPKTEARGQDPEYLRARGTRREDGGTTLQA